MLITNTFFWVKILELINSVVCFGLKTYYEKAVSVMMNVENYRTAAVRMDILSVATCAFTFVILLAVIISYAVHGDATDKNIMVVLFSVAGFIVNLSSGIFILSGAGINVAGYTGALATGVMLTLNSLLYLFDLLLALFCKCIRR